MEWAVLVGAAIGFAISPVSLIELIMVLVSKRRGINSIVFTLGIIVLGFVGVVMGALGSRAIDDNEPGPSRISGIILTLLAIILLALAANNWRNRADSSELAVFTKIGDMGPGAVLVLALGATLLNPKNLVIVLTAGQAIGSETSGFAVLIPALVFVIVATVPFWSATLYALWGGDSAQRRLDALRTWLMAKNRLIMAIMLGVLGLLLLVRGITAIIG